MDESRDGHTQHQSLKDWLDAVLPTTLKDGGLESEEVQEELESGLYLSSEDFQVHDSLCWSSAWCRIICTLKFVVKSLHFSPEILKYRRGYDFKCLFLKSLTFYFCGISYQRIIGRH